ncbi:MAG: hypothetical protein KAI79_14995, partial [Bacteroidales bacterium]|nr:hypothetical protein [Bacteroidales bacterium]
HDIVITTSTLREGFNINEHVDHMVVLGGRTVSVEDTVQFIARARKNVPEVHILINGKLGESDIKIPEYSKYHYMGLLLVKRLETDMKRQQVSAFDAYDDLRKSAIVTKTGDFDEVGLQQYYKKSFDRCTKDSFKFRKRAFKMWGNYKVVQTTTNVSGGIKLGRDNPYYRKIINKYTDYNKLIKKVEERLRKKPSPLETLALEKILEKHSVIQWRKGFTIHTAKNPHSFLLDSKKFELLKQFKLNTNVDYSDNKPLKIGSTYKEKTFKDNIRKYIRKQGKNAQVDIKYALKVAEKKYFISDFVKDNEVYYFVKGVLDFPTCKSPYTMKKFKRASDLNAQIKGS